jgi:predicted nuclease of predicted toxin-antitoxin system
MKWPDSMQWVLVGEMKPSFYLDEDVSPVYAQVLEKNGFVVTTTAQSGGTEKSDAAQLTHCIEKGAILITHNLPHFADLAGLVLASGGHYPGIIGIHQLDRLGRRRSIGDIAKRLLEYVKNKDSHEFQDTFQVIA